MTTKTRRAFADEFKAETATLLDSSGRPLTEIAAELGIEPSVLRNWRRELRPGVAPAMAAGDTITTSVPTADQAEVRRLRCELARLRMEQDILKKAIGIFSGTPCVHATLWAEGRPVGPSQVEHLMRRHGIQANRRRAFCGTTDSQHAFLAAPNLLARNFNAARPNQIWLADMTYIRTGEGWLCLAAILDLFSRKIVGWAMSETFPPRPWTLPEQPSKGPAHKGSSVSCW